MNSIAMKNIYKSLIVICFLFVNSLSFAQNLSLNELHKLCRLSNWTVGNEVLSDKGWQFDSTTRLGENESVILYAYERNSYKGDQAVGWFAFYVNNQSVEKIFYQAPESAIKKVKASLSADGYKNVDSNLTDSSLTIIYKNSSFRLELSTLTRKGIGETKSVHSLTLIKNSGYYDPANGEKTEYFLGRLEKKYTLKDGKMQGKCYEYFSNGKLKSVGTYNNGILEGEVKIFEKDGTLMCTDFWKNGKLEGIRTTYSKGKKIEERNYKNGEEDGKCTQYDSIGNIKSVCYYKNGELSGPYTLFDYDDEGVLSVQLTGKWLDSKKEGYWEAKKLFEGKWVIIAYQNYKNDVLNGRCREIKSKDTVVFCNYKNGVLDGKYQAKGCIFNLSNPNLMSEDEMITLVDGEYSHGLKTGHWVVQNSMCNPVEIGDYIKDKRHGEWKFYQFFWDFDKIDSIRPNTIPMGWQLDHVANYNNGKLNGIYVQYKERGNGEFKDSVDYVCYYEDDLLNGAYEKHDNDGNIISSGQYAHGIKTGYWTETNDLLLEHVKWQGNYVNGERNGVWKKTVKSNGDEWDSMPSQEMLYENGMVKEVSTYSQKSYKLQRKFMAFTDTTGIDIRYDSAQTIKMEVWFPVNHTVYGVKKNGKYQVYDNQNRLKIEGQYSMGKRVGEWTYKVYEQMLYYIVNKSDTVAPKRYYTRDGKPYSGVYFDENVEYKIKKGLIHEAVFTDKKTGKIIKKEKYKNGKPQPSM